MAGHMRERRSSSGGAGLALAVVFFLLAAGVVALVATGTLQSLVGATTDGSDAGVGQPAEASLQVKAPSEYDWGELAEISAQVAAASTDEEGLAIARAFGLVREDGVPVRAPIDVPLSDGTLAVAQLIGVRQDACADGGVAGLTYMLSVVEDQPMEAADTTVGGWEKSALRSWAATEGRALLPAELSSRLVSVSKVTNNVGIAEDASALTETDDELWCLSVSEVCGEVAWFEGEYGPTMVAYDRLLAGEGGQYAWFAAAGVTGESDPGHALALTYRGAQWNWWYRTPYPYVFMGEGDSGAFFQVTSTGFPSSVGTAASSAGVVLGFCI